MKISLTKINRGYNQKTWQTMVAKHVLFVFNLLFASLSIVFDLGNVKAGFIFAHSDFRVQ